MKSIFAKVKQKLPENESLIPLPISIHGDKNSLLNKQCDRVSNLSSSRVKSAIQTLRISAATAGSYSLSCNQINLHYAIFAIHKDPSRWTHPDAYSEDDSKECKLLIEP